jgi:ATP-dependent Lon protease
MPSTSELTGVAITLTDRVIFPQTIQRIRVSESIKPDNRHVVVVFTQRDKLMDTGVLCELIDEQYQPDGRVFVLEGMQRVLIKKHKNNTANYTLCETDFSANRDLLSLSNTVYQLFKDNHTLFDSDDISMDTLLSVIHPDQPSELADFIASYMPLSYAEKLSIIASVDVYHRLEEVKRHLSRLLIDAEVNQELDTVIQQNVDSERKEMMLKAKLRAIQSELNRNYQHSLIDDYTKRLQETGIPSAYHDPVLLDIQRLQQYPDDSSEFGVLKGYLDTLFSIPWKHHKSAKINIERVKKELNQQHYGLERVKQRILEHLAVRKISKNRVGSIICLVGPPGVGKTSIVKSISQALRRPYCRISLGGVRDTAELRGHRRTYVGSMPGKIISNLIKAKAMNPVICLDEIDKLSSNIKGDPADVLLEILDIEQNKTFVDHYIQCPVNLSHCMFICTANNLDAIPAPLLNRLEVIPISGYTVAEKVVVARDYLFPKACKEVALPDTVQLPDKLWASLVHLYTSDVGLREIRQVIDKLCRKLAFLTVNNRPIPEKWTQSVCEFLLGEGQPKPSFSVAPRVGRSVGLMLHSMVGYCCPIETQIYQGNPGFTATGNIDPSLEESIRIVFGLLKTRFKDFKIDPNILFDYHFHIHFHNTNLYKKGNGFDLGVFVSIISTLLHIPLPGTITFSGQLSLSGKILPIGGVSQRLLAGSHLGITHLIVSSSEVQLPNSNQYTTKLVSMATVDDLLKYLVKMYL